MNAPDATLSATELLEQTMFVHDTIRRGARMFERAIECLAFDDATTVHEARRWFRFYWHAVERHHRRCDDELFPALARAFASSAHVLGAHGVAHDALAMGATHIEAAFSCLLTARDLDERAELAGALRLHATALRAELEAQLAREAETLSSLLERPAPVLAGRARREHRDAFAQHPGGALGASLEETATPSPQRPRTPAAVRESWRARRRARVTSPLERIPTLPVARLPTLHKPRAA